jgi:hypothetical protein
MATSGTPPGTHRPRSSTRGEEPGGAHNRRVQLALGVRLAGYAIGLVLLICTIVFALTRTTIVLVVVAILTVVMFGFLMWASLYRDRLVEKERRGSR